MTVVVSDLVARVHAEGVEQTTTAVKAVGDAAAQTARALQIMAEQATKAGGGTPQGWMQLFQQSNVQPTAAAMAQAATEMQKTAAAAAQAVQPSQAVARAAVDHAAAARNGAQAAQAVADGWKLSESSVVRFGAGLAGVSLGISLIAGAARLVHDAIVGTVEAQVDWERSLVQVRALYGDIAPRVVALSQAQANLPGVISSQQELLQANISARFLTTRYGISPDLTGTLTTQAARLGGLYALPADQRQALQSAFLAYSRTGGGAGELESATGQPYDPLTLARRLGFTSEAALGALTPQQLTAARAQLVIANSAQTNIGGGAERRGLLDAQRTAEHNLTLARDQVQNGLENIGRVATQPVPLFGNAQVGVSELGQYYERGTGQPIDPRTGAPLPGALGPQTTSSANGALVGALQDVREARDAVSKNSAALAENQKQLEVANNALAKLGVEAGSSAARLLSFTGSLEDVTSIARGDIGASAQAAVAARGRSAIPTIGTPSAEIAYQATQTAYQQAYQNYVARQAQGNQDNAIRDYLQRVAGQEGPSGPAQRALDQAQQAQPVQLRIGEAQRRAALVDMQTAETQSRLQTIALSQQERQVQLLRDTVDLRRLDVQQQMQGVEANQMVIRAQQAALPTQRAVSAANYQVNLAQALSDQRMARLLQGKDVSDLRSVDDLIRMSQQGQFAAAELEPAGVRSARGIELAQQTATAAGFAQQATASQLQLGQLGVDLKNLGDLPTQTALELELVQNNRDQLSVQQELREYMKQLVYIMTPGSGGGGGIDLGTLIFGDSGNTPAPSSLPGARRGPF